MAVMTAQPPLPLAPGGSVPIGDAVALLVDGDGGRVFVHGVLTFAWDAGDEVGRRVAAVQLVRTRAASAVAVADGFGMTRESLRRWGNRAGQDGVAGLVEGKRGPKGPSKVTPERVEEIRELRGEGLGYARIAARVGVSVASVRRALGVLDAPAQPDAADQAEETPDPDQSEETPDAADQADGQPDAADQADGRPGDARDGADAQPADRQSGVRQPAAPPPVAVAPAGVVLPVLGVPVRRGGERAAARAGLLDGAPAVFTACARVPLAGLFLALPGIEASGLLGCAAQVFPDAPGGFYGRDTLLLEGVLRALAGAPRAEGATRMDPVALGRVLGMDRAPQVKTIRRRIGALAALGRGADLQAAMAAHHLAAADEDPEGLLLYVDGHVRAYTGTRRIAKTHSARLRFPAPATMETWVTDASGDPVLVVMASPAASLAGELRSLLPALRAAVGDDRRVLVGFDRGGWSPELFEHLHEHGFDTLTWRKGPAPDVDEALFTQVTHTDPVTGITGTWTAADTIVDLPIGEKGRTFRMRQVTRQMQTKTGTRQAHVLTTRTDLPTGQVLSRMGSRWRVENYFRYARIHLDLDAHDSYAHHDDDPTRTVPNPARKTTAAAVKAARAAHTRAAAAADAALLALGTPPPGATTWTISNTDHNQAVAGLHAAADQLEKALAVHAATPTRLPLGQVHPGQQVLDTETKLLTHTLRMTAFHTLTALARDIRLNTGYRRAADQAHTLARQALAATGDIHPDPEHGTLTITLDPLPTRPATTALAELAAHLTTTATRYPGTDLTLHYAVKPHP